MNSTIQEFVNGKRIALAGASRTGNKFGNAAYKELTTRGYEVYLVHPEAQEVEGVPCYPNLASLPGEVDGVLVCLPASQGTGILREASGLGIRNVWVQQGGDSPELLSLGQELGLNLVSGKCILMYAPPVRSFHRFHRGFVRLIGQL